MFGLLLFLFAAALSYSQKDVFFNSLHNQKEVDVFVIDGDTLYGALVFQNDRILVLKEYSTGSIYYFETNYVGNYYQTAGYSSGYTNAGYGDPYQNYAPQAEPRFECREEHGEHCEHGEHGGHNGHH